MLQKLLLLLLFLGLPLLGDYYISNGQKQILQPLKSDRATDDQSIRYFKTQNGKKFGVTKNLLVGYKNEQVRATIEKKYPLTLLKKLTKNIFLYQSTALDQTLSIANQIAQEEGVKFSHPDFVIKKHTKTADPYYDFLWHLKNNEYPHADINVEKAWRYTKGANVIAAIIDEGIDIDHKDLRENIIGFANFNDPNSNYPDTKDGKWHGTACAGLLAAVENDTGVVGVAPKTKLYAVRYADASVSKDIEAFVYLMNEGVSVISNSWGSYANLDAYNEVFKLLATEGRDGKGILIFFAAGNDSKNLDDPGIDDESESPYVISIGSSTHRDEIASYSNYGSSLDFLAPGGVQSGQLVTTDAMGEKGYTDWNYNFNFIGTSASAPIAAGVGALMLSANPDLTREEVLDILQKTSKKIGNFKYTNGRNDHAGYGRIDAGAAVKMAKYYHQPELQQSNLHNFAYIIFQSIQKYNQ